MFRPLRSRSFVPLLSLLSFATLLPAASSADPLRVNRGAAGLEFQVATEHAGLQLTVVGPSGVAERFHFPAGAPASFPLFHKDGSLRADGAYRYEVVAAAKAATEVAVAGEEGRERAAVGVGGAVVAGTFRIVDGAFVLAGDAEEAAPRGKGIEAQPIAAKTDADGDSLLPVFPDNLIVQASACIGFDCVSGESFGFDTIRLKENSMRIKFDDTSTTAGFPARDWQLTANDSASGGANKFSIEDITGALVPFTVEAGAATNSLFVDSTSRIGLRTATPVLDLHISTGNTPAIRLEQNAVSGFTAQTWDIAGNEANFFVRDVTSGSRLPFRIRPGAPSSSIDISSTGNVGIGLASAAQKLHVRGSDGTTQYLVEETNGTNANRVLMSLVNNGPLSTELVNSANGKVWRMNALNGGFAINLSSDGQGDNEMFIDDNGNVTTTGTVNGVSDRNMKRDIVPVDAVSILDRVARMPIATWSYKHESAPVRHLGPMAQDFSAAFGLGADERSIALTDMAGVSLAAIQALNQKVDSRDAEIAALKAQNEALAARLAALEAALLAVANTNH